MPPSKVLFTLETLKQKAFAAMDKRIEAQQAVIDSLSPEADQQAREDWREDQIARILDLAQRLNNDEYISDDELSRFRVASLPATNEHDRARAERNLKALLREKSRLEATVDSLRADEDGSVPLTPTQLSQFFGL